MKFFLCFCSGVLLGKLAYATTMDITEVSIGEFSEFVASSGLTTHAEQYGGMAYEGGWVVKPNWNRRAPYGEIGAFDEPAVHVTYEEAEKYCKWRGKRLPTKQRANKTRPNKKCPTTFAERKFGRKISKATKESPSKT